jgi:ribonuclease E
MHLPGEAAGQPVDATSRTWESKQSNQLDFTSEYEDGDSELGGGLEPNLVNHPSYQERGNLRRRGKRAMLNKDPRESREPEKVIPADVRSRFEPRIEPLVEPRFEPRIEREVVVDRSVPTKLSLPNIPTAKAIAEPSEELVEVIEAAPVVTPDLPERPNKREIRTKVIEPPEVIVVEMTEEEQDVYSQIGVSPLVLLDREVKDPRNVIVTVALPGQAPKIANNIGNLRSRAESVTESRSDSGFESNTEVNLSVEQEEQFAESLDEQEIIETPTEPITINPVISPVISPVKNGISNGVILRVNRAQSTDSLDNEENLDSRSEPSDTSKEFVPIQSPEASRRKRSSAAQP